MDTDQRENWGKEEEEKEDEGEHWLVQKKVGLTKNDRSRIRKLV